MTDAARKHHKPTTTTSCASTYRHTTNTPVVQVVRIVNKCLGNSPRSSSSDCEAVVGKKRHCRPKAAVAVDEEEEERVKVQVRVEGRSTRFKMTPIVGTRKHLRSLAQLCVASLVAVFLTSASCWQVPHETRQANGLNQIQPAKQLLHVAAAGSQPKQQLVCFYATSPAQSKSQQQLQSQRQSIDQLASNGESRVDLAALNAQQVRLLQRQFAVAWPQLSSNQFAARNAMPFVASMLYNPYAPVEIPTLFATGRPPPNVALAQPQSQAHQPQQQQLHMSPQLPPLLKASDRRHSPQAHTYNPKSKYHSNTSPNALQTSSASQVLFPASGKNANAQQYFHHQKSQQLRQQHLQLPANNAQLEQQQQQQVLPAASMVRASLTSAALAATASELTAVSLPAVAQQQQQVHLPLGGSLSMAGAPPATPVPLSPASAHPIVQHQQASSLQPPQHYRNLQPNSIAEVEQQQHNQHMQMQQIAQKGREVKQTQPRTQFLSPQSMPNSMAAASTNVRKSFSDVGVSTGSPLASVMDVFGAASQYLMRFKPSSLISPAALAFNSIPSSQLDSFLASQTAINNITQQLDAPSGALSLSPMSSFSALPTPSSPQSLQQQSTKTASTTLAPNFKSAGGFLARLTGGASNQQQVVQRREDVCGRTFQMPQRRIIGGEGARYGEFPYQVHIKIAKHQCGGALVDRQAIVTAAHCVYHFITRAPVNKLQIVIGAYDIEDEKYQELPPQYFKVDKVKLHPNFRFSASHPDRYDIAILKLDKPVKYTDNVMPVCLPGKDLKFENRLGTVTGFGKTDSSLSNRYGTRLLQKVDVPIIENSECERWHRTRGIDLKIFPEMMCAGYEDGLKDACVGDSGGPLVVKSATGAADGSFRWTLAGITSAGFGCAQSRQPGIYHRVSHTVDWILENLD